MSAIVSNLYRALLRSRSLPLSSHHLYPLTAGEHSQFCLFAKITIVSKLKQAQNAFGGLIIILIVLPIMSVVIIIIKDRGLRRVD